MARKIFEISGWDDAKPLYFVVDDKAELPRLIDTCNAEIALIEQDIQNFSIPFPEGLALGRQERHFAVKQARAARSASGPATSPGNSASNLQLPVARREGGRLRRAAEMLGVGRALIK